MICWGTVSVSRKSVAKQNSNFLFTVNSKELVSCRASHCTRRHISSFAVYSCWNLSSSHGKTEQLPQIDISTELIALDKHMESHKRTDAFLLKDTPAPKVTENLGIIEQRWTRNSSICQKNSSFSRLLESAGQKPDSGRTSPEIPNEIHGQFWPPGQVNKVTRRAIHRHVSRQAKWTVSTIVTCWTVSKHSQVLPRINRGQIWLSGRRKSNEVKK